LDYLCSILYNVCEEKLNNTYQLVSKIKRCKYNLAF
jgi:hypothetical protein